MIKKLKQLLNSEEADAEALAALLPRREPDLRTIGLFSEVEADKIAEISHALLYLNELNAMEADPKKQRPILF